MNKKIKQNIKLLLIIILPFVILAFSCCVSNAENQYSEIIDYRQTDVDYEKGLTLYGDKEEKYKWEVISQSNVTKFDNYYFYFTRDGAKNAKVEIKYPSIRCVYR